MDLSNADIIRSEIKKYLILQYESGESSCILNASELRKRIISELKIEVELKEISQILYRLEENNNDIKKIKDTPASNGGGVVSLKCNFPIVIKVTKNRNVIDEIKLNYLGKGDIVSLGEVERLKSGTKIDNAKLCAIFGCSTQGGMRRSTKTNTLVLVSNHVKSIYGDRWDNDILHYTGMGTTGDQTLKSQNKTLAESNANGITVHLFEVFKQGEYTYVGEVELLDKPYKETQPDIDGNYRSVYVFPLKIKDKFQRFAWLSEKVKNEERRVQDAFKLNLEELKKRAQSGLIKPTKTTQRVNQYERNSYVSALAKRLANGICQLCKQSAPFFNNGIPYLEVHHIEWLSRGGADIIENTVALCPNCHRKMHILDLEKDVNSLKKCTLSETDNS